MEALIVIVILTLTLIPILIPSPSSKTGLSKVEGVLSHLDSVFGHVPASSNVTSTSPASAKLPAGRDDGVIGDSLKCCVFAHHGEWTSLVGESESLGRP